MNIRQQKYKKNLLSGMSKKAAALEAGYSLATAINVRKNIENRCDMDTWLERKGLTDEALARHAEEGLQANKTISVIGQADGKSTDFIDVPDWAVRHRYFETILKLKNKLKQPNSVDQSQHTHLTFHQLSKELAEEELIANIRGNQNRPSAVSPGPGVVFSESLKRFSMEETNGDHGSGEGQTPSNGQVS